MRETPFGHGRQSTCLPSCHAEPDRAGLLRPVFLLEADRGPRSRSSTRTTPGELSAKVMDGPTLTKFRAAIPRAHVRTAIRLLTYRSPFAADAINQCIANVELALTARSGPYSALLQRRLRRLPHPAARSFGPWRSFRQILLRSSTPSPRIRTKAADRSFVIGHSSAVVGPDAYRPVTPGCNQSQMTTLSSSDPPPAARAGRNRCATEDLVRRDGGRGLARFWLADAVILEFPAATPRRSSWRQRRPGCSWQLFWISDRSTVSASARHGYVETRPLRTPPHCKQAAARDSSPPGRYFFAQIRRSQPSSAG